MWHVVTAAARIELTAACTWAQSHALAALHVALDPAVGPAIGAAATLADLAALAALGHVAASPAAAPAARMSSTSSSHGDSDTLLAMVVAAQAGGVAADAVRARVRDAAARSAPIVPRVPGAVHG